MSLHTPVGPEDHILGPDDAPATLVEYGDYQCPACGEAYPEVKRIKEQFGDQLRLVFRNFPLSELHPEAVPAANAAEFAAAGGKFWEAHDDLYENQQGLGQELYVEIANRLGLQADGMIAAVDDDQYRQRIERDVESGLRSGVPGTPTFFLNGELVRLERSFDELVDAIQQVLGR